MTNPRPETVNKLATVKLFEKRLSPLRKPMYVITFLADDGEAYTKLVTMDQPHWQKMFFNMGQDTPDFLAVEKLVGNKVELVISKETNLCMYVNRLSPKQMLDHSTVVQVIGDKNLIDKIISYFKDKK